MIIYKAEVSARGEKKSGVVRLTLVRKADGWTYAVDKMGDDEFTLTWRAKTAEKASVKLTDIYRDPVWDFHVTETSAGD